MEDTHLTQNNSPATGPLVAKTSDGLNLSLQTYGDVGNEEILFIHGFGQSRLSWSKQTSSSLTEHCRVVTLDLRGHENSDKPDHAAAYVSGEQWADDLHAVMETAGLWRPTLVGWSLGGFIIGLYLAKYGRERTAGINLVETVKVFSTELELFTQTFRGLLPRLASPDLSERATATAKFLASCFATKPEAGAFEQMLVVAGMMPLVVTQGVLNISGTGLDEAFAKSGPMLVTYGAKDLLTQPTMSTRMQALNQEAQISFYPESGHAPSTTNQTASTASCPRLSVTSWVVHVHRGGDGRVAHNAQRRVDSAGNHS